jgi:LruC domain-containing protein
MKKSNLILKTIALSAILFIFSCTPKSLDELIEEEPIVAEENNMMNLVVPEGFDFSTSREVTISIQDLSPSATYTIYAYNDLRINEREVDVTYDNGETGTDIVFETDDYNQVLFTGKPVNGQIEHTVPLANYYKKIYVHRNENGIFSGNIVDIQGGNALYVHMSTGSSRKAQVENFKASNKSIDFDTLYCVNGSGQLFTVDPLNGDLTEKAAMPQGSWTAAIDHANLYLYSIGKNRNYPLMRYDMINDSWTIIANVGMGGPRLAYNDNDGLLYFSTQAKLYTIDPTTATVLSSWDISNLNVTQGGDLAFAEDQTMFLASFGGLYRLDAAGNGYNAVRISADNLPFYPTSMTFDSNNELWLANSSSSSDLIIMDTQTGGWEYIYGPNATSGVNFERTINDLTTYTVTVEVEDPDSDGDGVSDSQDAYPNEADKAFETFTPSKYGWGTVAFEDLWPFQGDYDFNDTAVNYRFVAILNAQNEVVQVDIHFEVTSDGAGLNNAFGIEFESIAPYQVASVTGTELVEGYISVGDNGVENDQDRAVVILFDNNGKMVGRQKTVSIEFTVPLSTAQLGIAPHNAFLIVNNERSREIHLPNRLRTSLGANVATTEGVNQDIDGNYETDGRLPWAINIAHDFKVPKERIPVNQAYNFFNDWASSGGTIYVDWYKDNEGYRNASKLQ